MLHITLTSLLQQTYFNVSEVPLNSLPTHKCESMTVVIKGKVLMSLAPTRRQTHQNLSLNYKIVHEIISLAMRKKKYFINVFL